MKEKEKQYKKMFKNADIPLHLQNPMIRETAKTVRIKILSKSKADIIVEPFYKSISRIL